MNIVLIGYGKMGKAIEQLAIKRGHSVTGKIDIETSLDERVKLFKHGDVAIEFSHPDAAFDNIIQALETGIPVVSGTTGWLNRFARVQDLIKASGGCFFYASNYSIGVNIMFAINEHLARIMNQYPDYSASIEETHHVHKKDEPSGTAITLAEGMISHLDSKSKWSLKSSESSEVPIDAHRKGEVFGDHSVIYQSTIDKIKLSHSAHTRDGFGIGALTAAEWLWNEGNPRRGIHSMKEMMGL